MKILRSTSYFGIGIRTFGHQFVPPDQVSLSVWITLLFMPIIPLRAVRCRYLRETNMFAETFSTYVRDSGYDFEELERIPLTLERIIYVVSKAWLTLGIACGPLVAVIYFIETLHQLPKPVYFLSANFSVGWGAVVLFVCSKRLQRFLIATKNDGDPTLTFEARFEETRDRRSLREMIRDNELILIAAAGTIPGDVLARAIGLKDQIMIVPVASFTSVFIAMIFLVMKAMWSK